MFFDTCNKMTTESITAIRNTKTQKNKVKEKKETFLFVSPSNSQLKQNYGQLNLNIWMQRYQSLQKRKKNSSTQLIYMNFWKKFPKPILKILIRKALNAMFLFEPHLKR